MAASATCCCGSFLASSRELLLGLAVLVTGCSDSGGEAPARAGDMATRHELDLPAEARETLDHIDPGGPYPRAARSRTRRTAPSTAPSSCRTTSAATTQEYTVETPESADRGAPRLVIGRGGETCCTDDHNAPFRAVTR